MQPETCFCHIMSDLPSVSLKSIVSESASLAANSVNGLPAQPWCWLCLNKTVNVDICKCIDYSTVIKSSIKCVAANYYWTESDQGQCKMAEMMESIWKWLNIINVICQVCFSNF